MSYQQPRPAVLSAKAGGVAMDNSLSLIRKIYFELILQFFNLIIDLA